MTYAYAASPGDVDRPPTEMEGRAIIAHGGRRTVDDAADGCVEEEDDARKDARDASTYRECLMEAAARWCLDCSACLCALVN